jgi:subtilisin family serine protease
LTVGLRPGVDVDQAFQAWGLSLVGATPIGQAYELELPAGSSPAQLSGALQGLQLDPRTRFAEPSRPLRTPEGTGCLVPTSAVSGLPCTISFYDGDPAPEKFYQQPLAPVIDLAGAQAHLTGTPSLVAVIDTGIDATHSLFAGRVFTEGYDFISNTVGALDAPNGLDDDLDGLVDEAVGHGTHVAGTIVLINPHARILPLKVLDIDHENPGLDDHLGHGRIDAGETAYEAAQ